MRRRIIAWAFPTPDGKSDHNVRWIRQEPT